MSVQSLSVYSEFNEIIQNLRKDIYLGLKYITIRFKLKSQRKVLNKFKYCYKTYTKASEGKFFARCAICSGSILA